MDHEIQEEADDERRRQALLFEALRSEAEPEVEHLSAQLVEQLGEHKRPMSFEKLRRISRQMADVEDNLEKLQHQIRQARQEGLDQLACARVGDVMVPLSVDELWRQQQPQHPHAPASFDPRSRFTTSIDQALAGVKRQLAPFLLNRIAATGYFHKWLTGGMGGTRHMLSVVVHSQTVGARVSYSPSYFVNYVALAAPTTPVQGLLDPGRYIFMLTAQGPLRLTDSQVFDVPPSFDISLMV
jgi:hypothetical protein